MAPLDRPRDDQEAHRERREADETALRRHRQERIGLHHLLIRHRECDKERYHRAKHPDLGNDQKPAPERLLGQRVHRRFPLCHAQPLPRVMGLS